MDSDTKRFLLIAISTCIPVALFSSCVIQKLQNLERAQIQAERKLAESENRQDVITKDSKPESKQDKQEESKPAPTEEVSTPSEPATEAPRPAAPPPPLPAPLRGPGNLDEYHSPSYQPSGPTGPGNL